MTKKLKISNVLGLSDLAELPLGGSPCCTYGVSVAGFAAGRTRNLPHKKTGSAMASSSHVVDKGNLRASRPSWKPGR
eukprot:5475004-Amphidinium_carterae.1